MTLPSPAYCDLASPYNVSAMNRFSLVVILLLATLTFSGCNNPPPKPIASPSPSPSPSPPPSPPSAEAVAEAARYRQQGLQHRQQGRMDEAIVALQKAVELDPQSLSGHVLLGWTQHLTGEEDAAAAALKQALALDETHVPALNALGIVYLVDGQLQAAVKTHHRAAELKPDNEIAYYNLSLAYQRLGDDPQAVATAEKATELEPGNPHPWVALAIAHWDTNPEAAKQAYRQALQLDGRYREAGFLAHLEQAGFSPKQIQLTDAIRTAL